MKKLLFTTLALMSATGLMGMDGQDKSISSLTAVVVSNGSNTVQEMLDNKALDKDQRVPTPTKATLTKAMETMEKSIREPINYSKFKGIITDTKNAAMENKRDKILQNTKTLKKSRLTKFTLEQTKEAKTLFKPFTNLQRQGDVIWSVTTDIKSDQTISDKYKIENSLSGNINSWTIPTQQELSKLYKQLRNGVLNGVNKKSIKREDGATITMQIKKDSTLASIQRFIALAQQKIKAAKITQ